MEANLNQKLAAVLDKHPELTPTDKEGFYTLGRRSAAKNSMWAWFSKQDEDGDYSEYGCHDREAHALIGMAMLNALPVMHQIHRWESSNGFEWGIFLYRGYPKPDVQVGTWHKSATEALLAFWNSRTHDADAKGGKG